MFLALAGFSLRTPGLMGTLAPARIFVKHYYFPLQDGKIRSNLAWSGKKQT
jgi:hypothetical protein